MSKPSSYIRLKITGIIAETADTKTFLLKQVNGEPIQYQAGQFLTLILPGKNTEIRRSYSLSSSPVLDEPLSITIKKVANGEFSRKLVDYARTGDELHSIGASGFFTLPEDLSAVKQVFFLAAGSGITPVFSLLKTIIKKYPAIKIVLVYSNRSEADCIFRKQLLQLQQEHPDQFSIEWLFSNNANLSRARLSNILLQQLLKEYKVPVKETLFYMCGPHDYMQTIGITLLTEGVPAQHIRKENFIILPAPTRETPPDQDLHKISIRYNGKKYEVQAQYPRSILQAGLDAGIDLPYSCRSGRCGTCAAICKSGKVWMSYNQVLPDEEVAKGRILTCVGYVIGGDAEILFK